MRTSSSPLSDAQVGVLYGLGAYGLWGFSAIYWRVLREAAPLEVLAHRVLWAAVLIVLLLAWRRRLGAVLALVRDRRTLGLLAVSGALLAVNWSIFVWASMTGKILQASLGYYINPLVSVVIGTLLLGERMSRRQSLAVGFAAMGVLAMVLVSGSLPWPALTLAITFAIYGYIRKVTGVVAMDALFVETALFVPVGFGLLAFQSGHGGLAFGHDLVPTLLLIGGGLVTLVPLSFFGEAVRRVRLSTVGLLQFLAPTLQFLLATLIFGEPFGLGQLVGFGFIWAGLALYTYEAIQQDRA